MKPIHTFAAALAMTSALSSAGLSATKVGVIGAANPQVYVERADGTGKQILKVGDEIFLNDKLSTDGKGSAQLMFLDKSALTISPESAVTIDTFVYDPAAKDGTMTVNGAKGAFRFIGGALTKKKAVKLKTPVSTIGIRGGIVDTHIAQGGKTDAVFLFGKEMTMTNAAGQTTSTTQFGTGLGLASAAGVPVSLPQNVVAARINSSPTQAAVAAAPPASAAQLGTLENKVQINSSSKAPAQPDASAPASSGGNPPATQPANQGSGNGNEAGPSSQNTPATPPTRGNEASGSASNTAAQTPNAAPVANSNQPAATTPAPVQMQAPAAIGMPEGMGMKAMAVMESVSMQAAPAAEMSSAGSETLYARVDNIMNGESNNDRGQQVRDVFNVEKTEQTAGNGEADNTPSSFLSRIEAANNNRQNIDEQAREEGEQEREARKAEAEDIEKDPALEETILTEIIDREPQDDGNGGANTATPPAPGQSTQWHELPEPTTHRGGIFHRDEGADSISGNDKIQSAFGGAYIDSTSNALRFKVAKTEERIGSYDNAASSLNITDDSRYIVGNIALPTGSGLKTITSSDVVFADHSGTVAADSLYGSIYTTDQTSFVFLDLGWNDLAGTPGDFSDDSFIKLRGYMLSSLLDGVSDTATAQTAYDTMLTNASGYASAHSGIIEYDFLPELIGKFDHAGTPEFGIIDYNQHTDFAYTPYSDNGLFVDYTNKKFLGGDVDFTGTGHGAPAIQALFGKVNSNTVISYDSTKNTVAGNALEGSLYRLKQTSTFDTTNNEAFDVSVKANNIASGKNANDAIEGFVTQIHDGAGNLRGQQGAVIGTDATAALLDDAPANETARGFTAGLITDDSGNVSRLKSAGLSDFAVQTNSAGTVAATVKYHTLDNSAGGFTNTEKTVKFGSSAAGNAALQKDLYAAEVNNVGRVAPGSETAGAIVSMHEAVSSEAGLVCSSCEFAHWGVWQVDHIDSGTPIEQTALVPYIAGQTTSNAQLATLAGTNPGVVIYTGQAAANLAITDGGGTTIHNDTGTFIANVDLTNRQIAASDMHINFNNIGGGTQDLAITNNAAIDFSSTSSITSAINSTFTNSTGASAGGVSGNINGAFFGSQAQEMGGNFYTDGASGSESIKAGGVYLGKR